MTPLLSHQAQGQGPHTVLLLNGGMMTYPSWASISQDLVADGSRVLGCDFRGQLSTPGQAHTRLIDNVPDVVDLLDHLDIAQTHVLGTSFGGEVGLLLAALHPERVLSLAAVTAVDRSPPGMGDNARTMRALIRDLLAGGDREAFHDALVSDIYSDGYRRANEAALAERQRRTAALPESWYQGLMGILKSVEDFDLSPWLPKIMCPTLVVHAAHDLVMPTERVEALAAAIRGAELVVHADSSHALVVEDPQWLSETYRRFLRRQIEEQGTKDSAPSQTASHT